jgi:hypothetical protein
MAKIARLTWELNDPTYIDGGEIKICNMKIFQMSVESKNRKTAWAPCYCLES